MINMNPIKKLLSFYLCFFLKLNDQFLVKEIIFPGQITLST